MRLLRFDLVWNVTEPRPGVYDFSSYDCWLPTVWAGGLRVLLILDYANSAYNGFGSPSTPAGVAAFARWAGAAAKHYADKDVIWEVYNEPLNFWAAPTGATPVDPGLLGPKPGSGACLMYVGHAGKENPQSWQDPYCQRLFGWYADMAIATAQAIRAATPGAFIIGPAASERSWYEDSNQTFLREIFARGVLTHFNAVTVHAYTTGPGRMWDPEEVLPAYATLRQLMAEHTPPGKRITMLDGEHGFPTACGTQPVSALDRWPWPHATAQRTGAALCGGTLHQDVRQRGVGSHAHQAVLLSRAFLVNMLAGITGTIWYDWRDPIDDKVTGAEAFGLIHCLANDTSSAAKSSGACSQTTPELDDVAGWGHPKPSFVALRTLHEQLDGYQFVARLPLGSPDRYLLHFTRTDSKDSPKSSEAVLVAWTRALIPELGSVTLPPAKVPLASFDSSSILGRALPRVIATQLNGSSSLQLLLTQSPVYLRSFTSPASTAGPAAGAGQCQAVLDLWCGTLTQCVSEIVMAGAKLPLVARLGLQAEGEWRCYSPSALGENGTKYIGGPQFCSEDKLLLEVLGICNGSLPQQPYPVPQEGTLPPPAASKGDPSGPLPPSAAIMPAGLGGVRSFRIPSVVGPFGVDSPAVIVFAEAREHSLADSASYALAAIRSPDGGRSWPKDVRYLFNDTAAAQLHSDTASIAQLHSDGINLGASVYDAKRKIVHVLFDQCADKFDFSPCGPTASLLLLSSRGDWGLTWQPLVNLTRSMVRGGFNMLNPGPGTGIQTSSGRLLVPAWGSRIGVPKDKPPCVGGCDRFWATNIYSDDGTTWQVASPVPNPLGRKPNELQAAQLLLNSSHELLVLNVRDEDGPERLLATSDTDGDTWSPLAPNPYLVGAICQGSTVSAGGVLFFSHPFDKQSRFNGWIKYSVDQGKSWWLWRQVAPSSFSYSTMTVVDVNATHVSLGVVYEAGEGEHEGAMSLHWTVITDLMPHVASAMNKTGSFEKAQRQLKSDDARKSDDKETITVTLDNTRLPLDTAGQPLKTGEIQVYDNHKVDGHWYVYISNWGCCRQVNCCQNNKPWPDNGCSLCCPAQRKSQCTYSQNHTIISYRTKDFGTWHALGALITPADRAPGTVFVPRVAYNNRSGTYVMWFENYLAHHGVRDGTGLAATTTTGSAEYSVAVSHSAAGPFKVIKDRPANSANFSCGGSQGDFDIFVDDDGKAYIVNTFYSSFCIEQLSEDFTGGTGKTTRVIAMDPTIKGHPKGDEAPTLFKRNSLYYLTYASGCCGCKGGSVTWQHTSASPLGPWTSGVLLTPNGPVTRAQQRSVFTVPKPDGSLQYIHVGNQWVPGRGGAGTCTNGGLLYWWPLSFMANGSIVPIRAFNKTATFQMAVSKTIIMRGEPPLKNDEVRTRKSNRGIRWAVNEPAAVAPWLLYGATGWANTSHAVSSATVGIIVQPVFSINTSGSECNNAWSIVCLFSSCPDRALLSAVITASYPDKLNDSSLTAYATAGHDIILDIGPWIGSIGGFVDRSGGYTGPTQEGLNCSSLTTQKEALAKHCVFPDQIIRAALARKEAFAIEVLALLKENKATGFGVDWETSYGNNQTNAAALWGYVKSVIKPHGMKFMPWMTNGGGVDMGPYNFAYCSDYMKLLPFADSLLNMGSYGATGYAFGPGNPRSIAPVLCTNRSAGVVGPSSAPAGRWCGLDGTVKDILTHGGSPSQLSPGIWMTPCVPNNTNTTVGWTQRRLKEFIDYAGGQGATTITIWGGLEASKTSLNATSPAVMDTCPWFVPTLLDWVAVGVPLKIDDEDDGAIAAAAATVPPVNGIFNGKDRSPPKSDEQQQLSNATLQWWKWVVTRVGNQAGWIPLNDTTGLRESFVKTWDPDLFDWGGDFRWQAGEWARLRGLPVAAATQFEYETAFWGLSYNNTKPNIVNTTWGRDGVSHDVNDKPVPASGVWPHMTQAAPLWHLACQQGTARIGLLGDSVTQDNSAGNLNGRDFTGGFGFWENTRFIESAVGKAAGVNTTFSIRNYVNQLRRVQGLHGDPLVRDPILSAFIHFTYTLWLKSWADLHSSTLRLAAKAGRSLPPAVYGNIGHKCEFTITLCLVCYRLNDAVPCQIRCSSLWNQRITMYIGLNPSCTCLCPRSSPRIILESAPQLR